MCLRQVKGPGEEPREAGAQECEAVAGGGQEEGGGEAVPLGPDAHGHLRAGHRPSRLLHTRSGHRV